MSQTPQTAFLLFALHANFVELLVIQGFGKNAISDAHQVRVDAQGMFDKIRMEQGRVKSDFHGSSLR
jgi:hypothetical protein